MNKEREQLLREQRVNATNGQMSMKQQKLEETLRQKTEEIHKITKQKNELKKTIESMKSTSIRIERLTKEIEEMKTQKIQLQRSFELSSRQHKQQVDNHRKELNYLEKEKREQIKQINELQKSKGKSDMLYQKKLEENAILQRQYKELKQSLAIQRKEQERYSKEDQKRLHWLEKQLQAERKNNQRISKLEKTIEMKNADIQKLRELIKKKEMQEHRKRIANRGNHSNNPHNYSGNTNVADSETSDNYDQEELEIALQQTLDDFKNDVKEYDNTYLLLKDNNYNEEKVLEKFRQLSLEDAREWLCVIYKRIADYVKELNEISKMVGDY